MLFLFVTPIVVKAQRSETRHQHRGVAAAGSHHDDDGPRHDGLRRINGSTLKFTENRGQLIDINGKPVPDVLYSASSGDAMVFFEKGRLIYEFSRLDGDMNYYSDRCQNGYMRGNNGAKGYYIDEPILNLHRMDMELVGANPDVRVEPAEQLDSYENYYLAQCRDGITGVHSWRRLVYHDVYPHIDMTVGAGENGAKIDFVVHPGGRISDIQMRYVGADSVRLGKDASLRVQTPLGYLQAASPYCFQTQGVFGAITSRYGLDNNVVTFAVSGYDPSQDLVIDPFQLWATFYGNSNSEQLSGGDPTEVDRKGNALIAGSTRTTFPIVTQPGGYTQGFSGGDEAFVARFSADGRLRWSTIYGGPQDELAHGVATDTDLNVFITGHTFSTGTGFPTSAGAFQSSFAGVRDAFAVKFDSNGVRLWGTLYGGSQFDDGYGFAVDSSKNVALLVTTQSSGMQTPPLAAYHGNYDVIVVKFNAGGNRVWAEYFGGSGEDYGYAAATDVNDNILISGYTYSTSPSWTMVSAAQAQNGGNGDAFVVKMTSAGAVIWSTYYGGPGTENNDAVAIAYNGLATNINGDIFLGGTTYKNALANPGFPVTGGAFQTTYGGGTCDAYVTKFDSNGVVVWSTYVGGSGADYGTGVASNASGGVLLTGFTSTANATFPTLAAAGAKPGAFQQNANAGGNDAFIVKLNGAGIQKWGTFFGGNGDDRGEGISFDPYGSIVIGGQTTTANLNGQAPFAMSITANPIIQANYGGVQDAFVSVLCDPDPAPIDSSGPHKLCDGDTVTLSVRPGYSSVKWYKKDPPPSGAVNELVAARNIDSIIISETGRFWAIVQNAGGCESSTDSIDITKLQRVNPLIAPASPASVCTGDTLILSVSAVQTLAKYAWLRGPGPTDTVSTLSTAKVTAPGNFPTGVYKVYVVTVDGCRDSTTVQVNEYPKPTPIVVASDTSICEDDMANLASSGGTGGAITWFKVGTVPAVGGGPQYSTKIAGTYYAISTSPNGCTRTSNRITVKVNKKPVPKITALTPISFCEGDSVVLDVFPKAGDAVHPDFSYAKYDWSNGASTRRIVLRESATLTVTVTDTNGCMGIDQITVTKNLKPHPKITYAPDTVLCEGDTVTLSADANYDSYGWNNGSTDRSIKVWRTGAYVLLATNSGCTGMSDTVHVIVKPRPLATISGATAVCTNTPAQYSVPAGTGMTYDWQVVGPSGSVSSGAGTNTIQVNWGPAGANKVIVMVTDPSSGCKSYDTVNVTVGSVLVPNITPSRSPQLCAGDSVTLDAGPGYSKYKWSTGDSVRTITVKTAGQYTVSVENATGCSGSSNPFTVTIEAPPKPVITPSPSLSVCPGDTVELDAGSNYRDYLWSNGATIQKIKVTTSGTYAVVVTDTNGCRGLSDSVTVVVNLPPSPVINGPNSVCINSADDYVAAGNPVDAYSWNVIGPGAVIQSGQGTPTINVKWSSPGDDTLEVTVTSASTGCVGTFRYVVNVGTSLKPQVTANGTLPFCFGDSIVITAPNGYKTYDWYLMPDSTNSIGSQQTFTVKAPGLYRVTVSDAGGCKGSGDLDVTQKAQIIPVISPSTNVGICPGDSALLTAPAGYAKYKWSTGESTRAIYVKAAGNYNVTVFDADGCSGTSADVTVTGYAAPIKPVVVQVGDQMTAVVDSVNGPKVTGYSWSLDGNVIPGAVTPQIQAVVVGMYSVTVVTANGCKATSDPVKPVLATATEIEVPQLTAAPGERVLVPLTLKSSTNLDKNNVENFQAKLRFHKTLLIPVPSSSTTSTIVGDDRVVTVTGARKAGMATGDLITLEFTAALGDVMQTPLTLETFRWLDTTNGPVPVMVTSGIFTLTNVCENGGERLLSVSGATKLNAARPNPTSGMTDIEYEVVERGRTSLVLVDMYGNTVKTLVDGSIDAGSYKVQFDARELPSGSYFCVLQTPTQRLSRLMQVVR
ncbi:MAG: SBBP repeat-containing protein [Bacteroidetes bacterium]|nr:SBBP repeat-containing protein [Bacteroidota bacterium]